MKFTTRLKPYSRIQPKTELNVEMILNSTSIHLRYSMSHVEEQLVWPAEEFAQRRDELWKTTCFEMFVGSGESSEYLEINLSPSGHWNVYHFDDYRSGMSVCEPAQAQIQSQQRQWLEAEVDCKSLTELLTQKPKIGVTAVLNWGPNQTEYWAMLHSGSKPDFHRRSDWLWSIK